MSPRSKSPHRCHASNFIDQCKPYGPVVAATINGISTAYNGIQTSKEHKLKRQKTQYELKASGEDLRHKKYMNRIEEENARIEQRHRLEEIGHPEWGPSFAATAEYSSHPGERYQGLHREPQQWQPWEEEVDERAWNEKKRWQGQPWEEEVDERAWYEKKRWQGLALGGIACASTAIIYQEREYAEETPPWEQKNLATAAWGVGILCTGAAIATAVNSEKRHSESRRVENRSGHRSNRHSSRGKSKHLKSSSRRR